MKKSKSYVNHPIFQTIIEIISCGKHIQLKFFVYLLSCSVLLSSVIGCASITIKDALPTGVPRGYVEFYYLKSEGHISYSPVIYSIENNHKTLEGRTSFNDLSERVGLRIAKQPGTYDFSVSLGTADEHVSHVRVDEGMVTPVKIQMQNISRSSSYNTTTIQFSVKLIVEETMPIRINKVNN